MSTFRFKQFEVSQDHAAMKVGTDGCLLGALAEGGSRILDIGTGTGLVALMMAQRFGDASVEAVEVDGDAARDARLNFGASPWGGRIVLHEQSFQEFCATSRGIAPFDSIVSNPPYFNNSLECQDHGRKLARHTSGLSFGELAGGVASLLSDDGVLSVVLPTEACDDFCGECVMSGLWLKRRYEIHTVPRKPARRMVMVFGRRQSEVVTTVHSLRNADNSYSQWYADLMHDFMLYIPKP